MEIDDVKTRIGTPAAAVHAIRKDEGERARGNRPALRADAVMGAPRYVQAHLKELVTMRQLGAGDAALIADRESDRADESGDRTAIADRRIISGGSVRRIGDPLDARCSRDLRMRGPSRAPPTQRTRGLAND